MLSFISLFQTDEKRTMTTRAAWLSPWVRVSLAFCTTSKRYVFLSVLFAKNFSPKNQITLAAFCAVGSSLARPSAAEKLGVGNFLLPLGYLSTRLRGSTLLRRRRRVRRSSFRDLYRLHLHAALTSSAFSSLSSLNFLFLKSVRGWPRGLVFAKVATLLHRTSRLVSQNKAVEN